MGTVIDVYQLIRDLIQEARNKQNLDMVNQLIDIKIALYEIQEENVRLKKELEQIKNIERHSDGNYVTLKNDELKIQYCATCWGNNGKLIQLLEENENRKGFYRCPICLNNWLGS